jgi:GDP-4-dehydro-6-deoxy-D-mannose reductase
LAEEVNVAGTQHVLDLAARLPARPRVVFVSSSYVYAQQRCESPDQRMTENTPLHVPLAAENGYAATKLAGEARVQEFVQAQGGDAVSARAFQHAGPRQSPRFMLAQWCEHFARRDGSPVAIRKSHAYIDLSDVRDVVRAYRLLAQRGTCGEAYNVGSGRDVRTGELFERLRSVADATRAVTVGDEAVVYAPIADISKITAATGWRPEIPIEQTIEDTYRWWTGEVRRKR